jgi:hypothetical protein
VWLGNLSLAIRGSKVFGFSTVYLHAAIMIYRTTVICGKYACFLPHQIVEMRKKRLTVKEVVK